MSGYAYYSVQDVSMEFQNGKRMGKFEGFAVGLCVGFLGAMLICYVQFGFSSKVPRLSLLIGDLQRTKDDCEGIVFSVKNRWATKVLSDATVRTGVSNYRDLAARFNGISSSLEAMLSTGHDDQSVRELQASLVDAQQRYQEFRSWFDSLPRENLTAPTRSAEQLSGNRVYGDAPVEVLPGLVVDLTKHLIEGIEQKEKFSREHLIEMLRAVRFRQWIDLTGG